MPEELMNGTDVETIFSDISTMIYDAKDAESKYLRHHVILEYRKEIVRRGITREKTRIW